MLVKYYGKIFDKDKCTYEVRTNFLENGLFRFTQPNQLNDNGSEFRLYPYFNNLSPADLEYAIRELKRINHQPSSNIPNDDFLKFNILGIQPKHTRYDPSKCGNTNSVPLAEFDEAHWIENTKIINNNIIESMSNVLGIFSLSKNALSEHMWVMYASEGSGIAIEFEESHPFFKQYPPQDVSYSKEDRATYTYYEGIELINGLKRKNFRTDKLALNEQMNLFKRLSLSKKDSWSQEEEKRIIMRLSEATNANVNHENNEIYPNISLKKIPFEAFKHVIFGYNTDDDLKEKVYKLIENPELSHLTTKQVQHNHLGELVYN